MSTNVKVCLKTTMAVGVRYDTTALESQDVEKSPLADLPVAERASYTLAHGSGQRNTFIFRAKNRV